MSGLDEARKNILIKMSDLLADPELEKANAWTDMPKCPHCQNVYRYNVRTREVAK